VYKIKHYFRCLSVNLLHNNIGSLSENTLHPPFSPKASLRSFHFRIPFTKPDKLGSVNTRRKSEPFSSPVSSLLVERDRIGLKRCNRDLGFAWKSSSVGGVKVPVGACADIGVADPGVMAGIGDDPGVMAGVGGKRLSKRSRSLAKSSIWAAGARANTLPQTVVLPVQHRSSISTSCNVQFCPIFSIRIASYCWLATVYTMPLRSSSVGSPKFWPS
jgi:hypothetical protein